MKLKSFIISALLLSSIDPITSATGGKVEVGPYDVDLNLNTSWTYEISEPEFAKFSQYDCWAFMIYSREENFLINMEIHEFSSRIDVETNSLKDHMIKSGFFTPSIYDSVTYQLMNINGNNSLLAEADAGNEHIIYFLAYPSDESGGYGRTIVLTECIAPWSISVQFLDSLDVKWR